jgi:hypothetical protein
MDKATPPTRLEKPGHRAGLDSADLIRFTRLDGAVLGVHNRLMKPQDSKTE